MGDIGSQIYDATLIEVISQSLGNVKNAKCSHCGKPTFDKGL